jgi:type IV pilus assembly protein PilM
MEWQLTDEEDDGVAEAFLRESPDGPLPGTLRCRSCDQANLATRKFCTNCGTSLWEPCPECDSPSPVGEKYCGVCGVDLAVAAQSKADAFEEKLRQVHTLRAAHCHDEALSMLDSMIKLNNRPPWQVQSLRNLVKKVAADRDRRQSEVKAAWAEAQQLASTSDYQAARDVLEKVPEPLRPAEMRDLLAEMRSRVDEIAMLEAEIHALKAGKVSLDLLPKLARLLTLRPGHEPARHLAARLARHCLEAARKARAACRYDESLRLVRRVPEVVRTPDLQAFCDEVAELAWLAADLRSAQVVDETLVAVAQRLCRLAPEDPRARELLENLRRRTAIAEKQPRRGIVAWAAPPTQTALGCPVDWVTGLQNAECRDGLDGSILARHPGCFFAAYGLALQGLGLAPIKSNLFSNQWLGVVERMAQMVRFRTARAAWGIDLSPSGLKAIKLHQKKGDSRLAIEDLHLIEHRKPLGQATNAAEQQEIVAETLGAFLGQGDVKSDRVCVGLPGTMVLSRELQLPPMDAKRIARAMEYEIAHQVPYHPRDLVWDYHVFDGAQGGPSPSERRDVMLVAAKREQVKDHLSRFHQEKLATDVVQTDCLALYNALAYEYSGAGGVFGQEEPAGHDAVALLDVGSETSNLVIGSRSCVWFRSIGVGSHSITKALVREFRLTLTQAEQLKRAPASAEHLGKLYEAIDPVLKGLVEEVHRSFVAFGKSHPQSRIERVLALGGGLQFHGLLSYLRLGRSGPKP